MHDFYGGAMGRAFGSTMEYRGDNLADHLSRADSEGAAMLIHRALTEDVPAGRNLVRAAVFNSKTKRWSYLGATPNSRVNQGASWQAGIMGNSSGAASCIYMAISTSATALAASDVVLPSELNSNGLARAAASYGSYSAPGSLNGSASFVLSLTYTYTSSGAVVVAKEGLNYTSTSGASSLAFENLFATTATVSSNGDQIAVTHTITI